jgi:hypothetical protein
MPGSSFDKLTTKQLTMSELEGCRNQFCYDGDALQLTTSLIVSLLSPSKGEPRTMVVATNVRLSYQMRLIPRSCRRPFW